MASHRSNEYWLPSAKSFLTSTSVTVRESFKEVPWLEKQNGDLAKFMKKEKMKKCLEGSVAHFVTEQLCSRPEAKCFGDIVLLTSHNKSVRYLLLFPLHKWGCQGSEVKGMWPHIDMAQILGLGGLFSKQDMPADASGW